VGLEPTSYLHPTINGRMVLPSPTTELPGVIGPYGKILIQGIITPFPISIKLRFIVTLVTLREL